MVADILREIFFPRRCLGCGTRETCDALCAACFGAIPIYDAPRCGTCQARLPECRKICHPETPYLLAAAGDYANPPLRETILTLKFKRRRDAAATLANLTARHIAMAGLDLNGFAAVPLPLSKRRERERGFNQAELIANAFARQTNIPIVTNAIIRTRHTKPQSEINNIDDRRANLANAFTPGPAPLPSRHILLIDDVTTSGATLREAARALKTAGARRIIALVAAAA